VNVGLRPPSYSLGGWLGGKKWQVTPRHHATSVASLRAIGRTREGREREWKRERDREWTGENHERVKKNIASGTARGTQRESTRSVCHFWTLVIGRRRDVRIGLLFIAVVLGGRYKKCYFCSGCLRRPLPKIDTYFLYRLKLLTNTIKNLDITINYFSSSVSTAVTSHPTRGDNGGPGSTQATGIWRSRAMESF
jgi:hypothetical protein